MTERKMPNLSMSRQGRVAVIGAGYWGKNLVRVFDQLGALGQVCDAFAGTRAAIRKQYPHIRVSGDMNEVLTDPTIDAVAIATPAVTHGDIAEAALNAGKDVFVEKPLCTSTMQAQKVIELAKANECILMVGHLLWYHPVVIGLKELVDSGELGRLQYIYSNRLNLGKLRREENVLWSFAPHDASVILGLVGEMPETVQASGGSFLHEKVSDTTVSMLTFNSGLRAHIFVSWLHPFKEQKLVVVGDKKMAVFNDTVAWSEKLHLYPHTVEWRENMPVATKGEAERIVLKQDEPLKLECEHFIECVRFRNKPKTDGHEGLRVLYVLGACERALNEGVTVQVFEPETEPLHYFTHPSAVVDTGVQIGKGSKIWHFSHILTGSQIGSDCNIGQNVVIGPNVMVGNGCRIQNNVSIYDGVTLEDDVFCGPSMVFTNVRNPRANISRKDQFAVTTVRKGATIGANATIVCGLEVGAWSFVSAGAVVTKDVQSHALVMGNPAIRVGWMCHCGEKLDDDLRCLCGRTYLQDSDGKIKTATIPEET